MSGGLRLGDGGIKVTSNPFYELYRKLEELRSDPEKCRPVIGELTQLCRETEKASSLDECLAEAAICIQAICQSRTTFALAISAWLTSDGDIRLAKALVHEASVACFQATTAKEYDLSLVDEELAQLAACRLCALHPSPPISLGWALSLATSYPDSETALQTAQKLLQHHIAEYPSTTQRLLTSESCPFKSLDLAIQGLSNLQQQETALAELPRIREFTMPPDMRLTYASLKRSENRDIQRSSNEKSFFRQFFTAQHFKYANKTAIEIRAGDDVHETSLEMTSFQLSVELPISELTNPLSSMLSRNKLWKGQPI